jgi:hypothetical protein
MNHKKLGSILLGLLVLVLLVLFLWRVFSRAQRGKASMLPEVANSLFEGSKIRSAHGNSTEITGELFFSCLNSFLENLDENAVKSLCTTGKYEGKDWTGKGEALEKALRTAHDRLFRNESVKSDVEFLLKSASSQAIIKGKLGDEGTKYGALADAFIFRLLREEIEPERYSVMESKKDDKYLKKARRACGNDGDLAVEIRSPGNKVATVPLCRFIETEINMLSSLISSTTSSGWFN